MDHCAPLRLTVKRVRVSCEFPPNEVWRVPSIDLGGCVRKAIRGNLGPKLGRIPARKFSNFFCRSLVASIRYWASFR